MDTKVRTTLGSIPSTSSKETILDQYFFFRSISIFPPLYEEVFPSAMPAVNQVVRFKNHSKCKQKAGSSDFTCLFFISRFLFPQLERTETSFPSF